VRQNTVAGGRIRAILPDEGQHTVSKSRRQPAGPSRRTFLEAAAGVAAGTALIRQPLRAQGTRAAAAGTRLAFPRIYPQFMITPDRAWEWNLFKSRGGPTYAGSTGWKRFADFLISKMPEFGAVDLV
jgi:hypothetical protein